MKIVADIDLPFLDSMFAGLAEVVRVSGPSITPGLARDADALIVRSVTRVDERLLAGSRAAFVGTATIGCDHVDTEWLASRGIAFASAPGCNANAVSEYIVAALLELSDRFGFLLAGTSLGVVGAGNVGSRVAAKARALGMTILVNDPPLERSSGQAGFSTLDELMECDIVTLHVPLTGGGPDPTRHLFGRDRIAAMKRGAILINSSRGAVVETAALARALGDSRLRGAVLDVWEGEPAVDAGLLDLATIGTAHIAGYSADAKLAASMMMYEALCGHFGWEARWDAAGRLPPPEHPSVGAEPPRGAPDAAPDAAPDPGTKAAAEATIRRIVRRCYPVMRDDAAMRKIGSMPAADRPGYFIGLRNNYPLRREFHATTVERPASAPADPADPIRILGELGFRIG